MNKVLHFIGDKFLNKRLDLRVRFFNVLAMSGILVSSFAAVVSLAMGENPRNAVTYIISCLLSVALLWYSIRKKRYQLCYMITIVAIFLIGFPIFFFNNGGYYGTLPYFFIFAIVFTIFMLEGKKGFFVAGIEIIVYIGICLYAYFFFIPDSYYTSSLTVMITCIFGFFVVGTALGITMFAQFRLYNDQQRELEAAREEALNLSQAKSNFLANMSHEIRTPINVMLGMNEMILREIDSGQVKSYGQNIQNAGKTLLLLIDNILDVSKIESGKLTVIDERYQTADLIDELSMIGTDQSSRYGLAFHTQADDTLPNALVGDAIHIRQVAVNFLSNAAKYTKEGSVTLSVGQKPGEKPDEMILCISVSDTGIGIKEEKLSLLFDAFMRADMPSNRYIEGTGLGLAIAKELTELMGGRIHVESQWGKGSVFSIELRQKIADKTPIGKAPRTAAKESQTRYAGFIAPGGSVLVVDDNKENLQVIHSLLSRTMLRVDTANSGVECLEAVGKQSYNIILMDYMMPDMDGLETLNRLNAIPGFDTPVIALTANVVAGVKKKLLAAGFREYLSKPVMWRDLEAALIAYLPEDMITPSMENSSDVLTMEINNELAQGLTDYGVTLSDGLRYLSGDIRQYKALASFFTQNYEPGKSEIIGFAEQKNWERMKFCVHSLKSKARTVGANTLAVTATKLETLCVANDGVCIALALPLLYHEWERARDGLTAFAARLDSLLPDISGLESAAADIDDLLLLLKHNRQPDALAALDRLMASARSPETVNRLREIRQKTYDIELRDAERLLTKLKEDGTDGK